MFTKSQNTTILKCINVKLSKIKLLKIAGMSKNLKNKCKNKTNAKKSRNAIKTKKFFRKHFCVGKLSIKFKQFFWKLFSS